MSLGAAVTQLARAANPAVGVAQNAAPVTPCGGVGAGIFVASGLILGATRRSPLATLALIAGSIAVAELVARHLPDEGRRPAYDSADRCVAVAGLSMVAWGVGRALAG